MSVYDNPRDDPDLVALRRAQEDPWVQYLVVCTDAPLPLAHSMGAVVRAVLDAATQFPTHPRYAEAWAAWSARSFRKVTLRAKGTAWQKVCALDAGVGAVDGVVKALALPPVLKSARDPLLAKLQAWTPAPEELPDDTSAWPSGVVMPFVLNAQATMRGGKAAAQVAHAALLLWEAWHTRRPEAFAQWRDAGQGCVFVSAGSAEWATLKATEACAVIRDAGLTEVAPGTETVLALVPCVATCVEALPRV